MQVARLSDVNGHPTPILTPPGINEVARYRPERSGYGINMVLVRFSRRAAPGDHDRGGLVARPVTTKPLLEQVHRVPTGARNEPVVKSRKPQSVDSEPGRLKAPSVAKAVKGRD